MTLFKQHSVEDHADSIAAYLPSGELFKSARITDSNFRKLLLGISHELFTAEGYLITAAKEYDIRTTTLFIQEWESALGIPDDCFKGDGTIVERRAHVLIKLIARGTQTAEDFIEMGNLLGLNLVVNAGIDLMRFPFTFPIFFFDNEKHARFSIVITDVSGVGSVFPLILPFTLGETTATKLICFLKKLKPANVELFYFNISTS